MKPEIETTASGYRFLWTENQITIEVSRIRVHNDGRITGEIFIRSGAKGLKAPSQLNFSAERTRESLIKSLATTYPGKAEWNKVIDELCYHVMDLTRQGEPVVELWSGEDAKAPEYVLEPFIIRNYPSIIFGDPGTTKSTLALIFSQIISLPWSDNPLDLVAPSKQERVLYLDWETDSATIKWQLTTLERGILKSTGSNVSCMVAYRRCSLPLANDIEEIKKKILEKNITVTIIDSLGLAAGGELKEAAPAMSFFSAWRQLNTTSLILAHSPKDNENVKNKNIYGSVFFQAQARNIWEIRKSQEQGAKMADIALYHKKPAPFQTYHAPIGFHIEYDDDSLVISKEDPRDIPDLLEHMGIQAKIIAYLEDARGSCSVEEIAQNTGARNINKNLSDLKKSGKIVNVSRGQWSLVSYQENLT